MQILKNLSLQPIFDNHKFQTILVQELSQVTMQKSSLVATFRVYLSYMTRKETNNKDPVKVDKHINLHMPIGKKFQNHQYFQRYVDLCTTNHDE